jgi:AhpD family alkylhydroperoxidase
MDIRMKELIFLGASVSAHCSPCFDYHLEKARTLGISEVEIQESIKAGYMVMNGADDKMRDKINKIFSEILLKGNESCSSNTKKKKIQSYPLVRF